MNEAEFKKRLQETQFVVEATSNEMQMLWEKFSDQAMYKNPDFNKFRFDQLNPGVVETIGKLDKRPVCISLFWWRIDGVMVMCWECTSQVADHAMIEKWLEKHCAPRWDNGTRLAHTNATNFHHVLHHVQDVNKSNKPPVDVDEQERQEALAVLDRLAQERQEQRNAALVTLTRKQEREEEHPLAFLAGRRHS